MEVIFWSLHPVFDPLEGDVEKFDDVEDEGDQRDDEHEDDEDGLLGGPGEEAVNLVRTGKALALIARRQAETIDIPLDEEESHLSRRNLKT